MVAPERGALERADIQGLVLSGYGRMSEARYVFLEVLDAPAARRWLGRLTSRITSCASPGEDGLPLDGSEPSTYSVRRNIAITYEGLSALGVPEEDLQTFPVPLREGMTTPFRQRVLGDVGPSDPAGWAWGGPDGSGPAPARSLHVLLLLFARDDSAIRALEEEETARANEDGALRVTLVLRPAPLGDTAGPDAVRAEHFGFADGISQPVVAGSGVEGRLSGDEARRQVVATGEFVLGYRNGYDKLTPSPRLCGADLGANGTYLVFRDLAQDVPAFRELLRRCSEQAPAPGPIDPDPGELLAAKIVGRWRSGAALVRTPHRDDADLATDNAFGYAEVDPHGDRCPLGSHVRRANPRDALGTDPAAALRLANLHRLLRRGRSYGPPLPVHAADDGARRGLHFLCVGANIERQFEFVQQSWCNNTKFAGLYDEQDPLLGTPPPGQGMFTVQGRPLATRVHGLSSFVTVRGGAYLFMPGLRALGILAELGS